MFASVQFRTEYSHEDIRLSSPFSRLHDKSTMLIRLTYLRSTDSKFRIISSLKVTNGYFVWDRSTKLTMDSFWHASSSSPLISKLCSDLFFSLPLNTLNSLVTRLVASIEMNRDSCFRHYVYEIECRWNEWKLENRVGVVATEWVGASETKSIIAWGISEGETEAVFILDCVPFLFQFNFNLIQLNIIYSFRVATLST